MEHRFKFLIFLLLNLLLLAAYACSDSSTGVDNNGGGTNPAPSNPDTSQASGYQGPTYPDDYRPYADFAYHDKWGPYNVHDPNCIDTGEWTYCYSTDVAYGGISRVGIQVRRSKDLVDWEFVGWAFSGIPQEAFDYVKMANNGTPPDNIWAPYIMKVNDTYRLYYSVSVFGSRGSYIGLATSNSPEGPWEQQGAVLKTVQSDSVNAIDPTVVVDNDTGEHWMAYGSWSTGLYVLQLDPATGKPLNSGTLGKRIAQNRDNALEAPEVIYNASTGKYYLFVSYGSLFDEYNVRVGRSDSPDGPYLDFNGDDMAVRSDNRPILMTPYKFITQPGWQGTGHVTVFREGEDYFMMHQGRLSSIPDLMVMHLRKISWTNDGWPVVPPERYAAHPQEAIPADSMTGKWEQIILHPLPGGDAQNEAQALTYVSDGSVTGAVEGSWELNGDELMVTQAGETVTLSLSYGWDWEQDRSTIMYTGLNSEGLTVWGKKVE